MHSEFTFQPVDKTKSSKLEVIGNTAISCGHPNTQRWFAQYLQWGWKANAQPMTSQIDRAWLKKKVKEVQKMENKQTDAGIGHTTDSNVSGNDRSGERKEL
jgi:hypothetical protein